MSKVKVRRIVLRVDGEPRGAVSDATAQTAVMLMARKKVRTRSGPESVLIDIGICPSQQIDALAPNAHLVRHLIWNGLVAYRAAGFSDVNVRVSCGAGQSL